MKTPSESQILIVSQLNIIKKSWNIQKQIVSSLLWQNINYQLKSNLNPMKQKRQMITDAPKDMIILKSKINYFLLSSRRNIF